MKLLGVDPGLTGALAFLSTIRNSVEVFDMPIVGGEVDTVGLAELIRGQAPDYAIVEQVASRPGQGVSSVFKFGMSYGAALAAIGALKIPHRRVTPAVWKKAFGLTSDKKKSRLLAISMWPAGRMQFARAKDDGRAEAALLAAYLGQRLKTEML